MAESAQAVDRVRHLVALGEQLPGRRPRTPGSGENGHAVLDLLQRARTAGRGEVRKKAERRPAAAAVEAGDGHHDRRLPLVGPVPGHPVGAPGTGLQAGRTACVPPLPAANVVLGGQICLKSQLNWSSAARRGRVARADLSCLKSSAGHFRPKGTEGKRKPTVRAECPEDGIPHGPGALPEKGCLEKKAVADCH